jgi:hypothetical protein
MEAAECSERGIRGVLPMNAVATLVKSRGPLSVRRIQKILYLTKKEVDAQVVQAGAPLKIIYLVIGKVFSSDIVYWEMQKPTAGQLWWMEQYREVARQRAAHRKA